MTESALRHIVIEGAIGVGKTTLAKRLAHTFGSDLILEMPVDNPFLQRYYQDPRRHALATQLFFLFQRAEQIRNLQQADLFQPVRVADFLYEKDRLFAELTLSPEEFQLYQQVAAHLDVHAPAADLVIYLQAPLPVLLKRIRARGVDFERQIEDDYLARLNDAYVRFFHDYTAAPLLIVNAAEVDLTRDGADYDALIQFIRKRPGGRHYLNLR